MSILWGEEGRVCGMSILTEKAVEKGLELLSTAASLTANEGPKLLDEYLNLMIFESLVGLLPGILVAAVLGVVLKWVGASMSDYSCNLNDERVEVSKLEELTKDLKGDTDRSRACAIKIMESRRRQMDAQDNMRFLKYFRSFIIVVVVAASTYSAMPTLTRIGKITLAPRIFLLQEGAEFIKSMRSK